MSIEIRQLEYDEKSLQDVCRLLQKVYPKTSKFTLEYIKWQYLENPNGKAIGFNAYDSDKVVAHYVGLPVRMMIFGKSLKGVVSINTATHPDYRGRRLFYNLAQIQYDYLTKIGFDFSIGPANAQSTNSYLKNLGFYLIAPLEVKVGFGEKIYGGMKNFECYQQYDVPTLKWRLDNPQNKYCVKKGIISSPLAGFAKTLSCIPSGDEDFKCWANDDNKKYTSRVNLYVGLGANLKNGMYFSLPKFVKHSPFNLVFRDLQNALPRIKKEDIFYQLIDFDVI
jgi:hypothetical protein